MIIQFRTELILIVKCLEKVDYMDGSLDKAFIGWPLTLGSLSQLWLEILLQVLQFDSGGGFERCYCSANGKMESGASWSFCPGSSSTPLHRWWLIHLYINVAVIVISKPIEQFNLSSLSIHTHMLNCSIGLYIYNKTGLQLGLLVNCGGKEE